MRLTKAFVPTLREEPTEAEIASHRLSLRAGLMRRVTAGVYTHLPFGHRVLQKIMTIIRSELDKIHCSELMMPIVQPAELWRQSGRWEAYGDEMFRLQDRHQRDLCLGPTHEEMITSLVGSVVNSYRQLPVSLYQIQNKYRDEIRPRFGVMRSREFVMKDAYSFDLDEKSLQRTYEQFFHAYERIFTRCGLTTHPVEADSGAIGGSYTHEFMVLAESGEDYIVHCEQCGYAANVEKAAAVPTEWTHSGPAAPYEKVSTPNVRTIEEVAEFLQVPAHAMIKTLLYKADDKFVAALVRGDRELNEVKLANVLQANNLEMAAPIDIQELTGASVGFSGPIGLKNVRIIADEEIVGATNAVVGANEDDCHIVNARWERDFTADDIADIRFTEEGDTCPQCKQHALIGANGIEVGQVFQLGTSYSKALQAYFKSETGDEQPIWMGCYGIGVTRTMAAVIEQHHDKDGIVWPPSIAPYQAVIIPIQMKNEELTAVAQQLYETLWAADIDTVFDDRQERPGVKFHDADLIGYPVRITIGPRSLKEGRVEIQWRDTHEVVTPRVEDALEVIEKGIMERMPVHESGGCSTSL